MCDRVESLAPPISQESYPERIGDWALFVSLLGYKSQRKNSAHIGALYIAMVVRRAFS
jgi:hypothetical protein